MVDSMHKTSALSVEIDLGEWTDRGPVAERTDRIAGRDVNEDNDNDDVWSFRC